MAPQRFLVRTRVDRTRPDDQRLPHDPAPPAPPRRVVEFQRSAERLAAETGEEGPRHEQIACGVADSRTPEVDDGAQPALADEQVVRGDVPVDPDRLPVPRSRDGGVHDFGARCGIDAVAEDLDRLPGLRLVDRERPSAPEAVWAGRGTARRVDRIERGEEAADIGREPDEVVDRRVQRDLAIDPPPDRPVQWELLARLPHREGNGDRKRKQRRELRQPLVLLHDLWLVRGVARQAHRHVVSEPERRVVPAVMIDGTDREIGPLRELRLQQTAHEWCVEMLRMRLLRHKRLLGSEGRSEESVRPARYRSRRYRCRPRATNTGSRLQQRVLASILFHPFKDTLDVLSTILGHAKASSESRRSGPLAASTRARGPARSLEL